MQPFVQRREHLAQQIRARGGGVAVLFTAPEAVRNRDSEYPYRWDSYFYYLTGFPEPQAALVMKVDGERTEALLFCREKNPEREIWDGFRFGPEAAAFGLPVPRGVLLTGIPGTGKSLTAKAAAAVLGKPLLRLDAGRRRNNGD